MRNLSYIKFFRYRHYINRKCLLNGKKLKQERLNLIHKMWSQLLDIQSVSFEKNCTEHPLLIFNICLLHEVDNLTPNKDIVLFPSCIM